MTTPATDDRAPLLRLKSHRIVAEEVGFRTKLLEIAAGLDDVIAMGRGDPDFHTPAHIVAAAQAAIGANEHHYTLPGGILPLRQAIAAKLANENGLDYAADEIIVTSGAQEAVMLSMLALLDDGDEVLLPSPRFTSYDIAVSMSGGVAVSVPSDQDTDFAMVPAEIEKRITPRTKVLVLVTPGNPTGAVTPPAMIREIAEIAKRHDLIVISDEIYEKLIWDGAEHLSIATLPGMRERTITINGFSKSYAMTGWRVGYLAAPKAFARMLIEPRHTLSINAATPSQHAALAALTGPQDAVEAMVAEYAERRAVVMEALDELGLTYGFPGGAFYVYVNTRSTGMGGEEFCLRMLREARVMFQPGTMFGDDSDDFVRIGYLQPLPRIREAFERVRAFIAKLPA
jgi:aminotransferase